MKAHLFTGSGLGLHLQGGHQRAGHINGRVSPHQDPYDQGEGEILDNLAADQVQDEHHDERGKGSDDGAVEGLVDGLVHGDEEILLAVDFHVFPYTVEDHDGIVEGIAHNGQEGGDDGQVQLQVEDGKDSQGDENIVGQGGHRPQGVVAIKP